MGKRHRRGGGGCGDNDDLLKMSEAERQAAVLAHVVTELVAAHHSAKNVSVRLLVAVTSKRYKLKRPPKLYRILSAVPDQYRSVLVKRLRSKPVRTASGIAVVAVMSKPHRCPHITYTGNICVYCPGGPDSDFEYSTQSYTGYEPTSMRAIRARYNPYVQSKHRIEQLEALGHSVDKVEYVIMGGTFLSLSEEYRDYFIRNLHDALSGHRSSSVAEAVRFADHAQRKCIGITIETRPDYCLRPHLKSMLRYGCTRLELGVQSVYEDVARDTNRGHTVHAVAEAFHLAKDCGFKVVAHMMPDLPNCGWERDLNGLRELFANPSFRPDGLKLYPTLVIRGTGLYELWRNGMYKNYAPDVLVDLVAHLLALVPPWVRVYRVQRDIPMPLVSSGVENGNLRELALVRMGELGVACRDVRSREVGMKDIHFRVRPDQIEFVRRDYAANGGWETFLSYEDPEQDILVGLLRLRCLSEVAFMEECFTGGPGGVEDAGLQVAAGVEGEEGEEGEEGAIPLRGVSMVRELHVYGSAVPVHARDPRKFQHQGFGTLLMEEAERVAVCEHRSHKMLVIAGVGTRHYYRKLGYELEGPYMVKQLANPMVRKGPERGSDCWSQRCV